MKTTTTNTTLTKRQSNQLRDALSIAETLRRNAQYTRDAELTHFTRNMFDQYQAELAQRIVSLIDKVLSNDENDLPF